MSDADPTDATRSIVPRPRRTFLGRLAGIVAGIPLVGWRMPRLASTARVSPTPVQPNAATLAALGDAVLPSELRRDGTARAVADFQRWMDGYRAGAEANHGYGTGRIEQVAPDPRATWTSQLVALDAEARRSGES
jgi:hypothetical protein